MLLTLYSLKVRGNLIEDVNGNLFVGFPGLPLHPPYATKRTASRLRQHRKTLPWWAVDQALINGFLGQTGTHPRTVATMATRP